MPDLYATRGLLGRGRYLSESMQNPGQFRVQLPTELVMALMHCGQWQRLGIIPLSSLERVTSPLPNAVLDASQDTSQDCLWHADWDDLQAAIDTLHERRSDPLCFRLHRILSALLASRLPNC